MYKLKRYGDKSSYGQTIVTLDTWSDVLHYINQVGQVRQTKMITGKTMSGNPAFILLASQKIDKVSNKSTYYVAVHHESKIKFSQG